MIRLFDMKDIKVIAFDCDGVLFDTAASNRAYYNSILKRLAMPEMTNEQFTYAHMHTVHETLAFLFGKNEKLEKAKAIKQNLGYAPFVRAMKMEPHLIPLLENLRTKFKTAIATNRTDSMPLVLTEHKIAIYFDLIVSANDVPRPKPHPDALIKILEHFKVEPHQVLYIGDSKVDEDAAKAAKIPLVAYNNPSLSAEYYIRTLKEVEDILGL